MITFFQEITRLLDHETQHGTQRSVAVPYAMLLSYINPESDVWGRVNRAIVERWSPAGLERVKKYAWDMAEEMDRANRDAESARQAERTP